VTTDAKHPESESIDKEKREQHKIIIEAMKKKQERSWSFLEASVLYNSKRLTPAGRDTVRWAIGILQCTLGDDFIQKAAEAPSPHPIFDLGLGLAYDLPQAYANLFQLAAEIELLQFKDGWSIVRDTLRGDFRMASWVSSLLQLEVGALGLKEGWDIEFERTLPTGKRIDAVLAKESIKLLVETKAMLLSGDEQEAESYFYRMTGLLLDLALKHGVRITGSIGSPVSPDVLAQWLQKIEAEACKTAQDGKKRIVPGPTDGQLEIIKEAAMPGISPLEGNLVETNVGRRFINQLITKNEQYKDAGPVWVRWGEYAGLWQSSSLQGKSLSEKLDILTPFLQTSLAFLPNLAGVILSPGKGALGNNPIEPPDTPFERNGGIAIRCLMPETNQKRESIIVIRAGEFTEQARMFTDLYQQESRWLDWALKKLGRPSFDELVHLSERLGIL